MKVTLIYSKVILQIRVSRHSLAACDQLLFFFLRLSDKLQWSCWVERLWDSKGKNSKRNAQSSTRWRFIRIHVLLFTVHLFLYPPEHRCKQTTEQFRSSLDICTMMMVVATWCFPDVDGRDPVTTETSALDETTLVVNDDEAFALEPVTITRRHKL